MTLAYLAVLATDGGRSFFQLTPLPWEIVATLLAIAATWTAAVLLIQRTRIVQRGFDIGIAWWSGGKGGRTARAT